MLKILTVTFIALGSPAFLKIRAKCSEFNVVSQVKDQVTAEVSLGSCDTGIGLRNTHMKENYLETAKFPKAVFVGTVPEADGKVSGILTVHGKPSPVEGERKADMVYFSTHVSSHGVGVPSFHGITVADEVKIEIGLEVKK